MCGAGGCAWSVQIQHGDNASLPPRGVPGQHVLHIHAHMAKESAGETPEWSVLAIVVRGCVVCACWSRCRRSDGPSFRVFRCCNAVPSRSCPYCSSRLFALRHVCPSCSPHPVSIPQHRHCHIMPCSQLPSRALKHGAATYRRVSCVLCCVPCLPGTLLAIALVCCYLCRSVRCVVDRFRNRTWPARASARDRSTGRCLYYVLAAFCARVSVMCDVNVSARHFAWWSGVGCVCMWFCASAGGDFPTCTWARSLAPRVVAPFFN